MAFDYEKIAKVTGTIGAPVSGTATITTTGPAISNFLGREFVLLISKVEDLAAAGTSVVTITDTTTTTPTTYIFRDDRGYIVTADRLYAKARHIRAAAILPVRCVLASNDTRVVALSYLPAPASGIADGGAVGTVIPTAEAPTTE